jgi:hypothetical protein
MLSFDFPQICTTCRGYKTMPFSWSGTGQPQMCKCSKESSLAWECPRCKKMNAPWKGSCDCTPSPLSGAPTCGTQPFNVGPIDSNHYYRENPNRIINFDHKDLK